MKEIKKFSIINAQYSMLNCDGDLNPLEKLKIEYYLSLIVFNHIIIF